MAGAGSRFQNEGYDLPKPFIEIQGKMMIERVLDGIRYDNATYTLIIQNSLLVNHKSKLDLLAKNYNVNFLTVNRLTQGASCTVLSIYSMINNDNPILICDCDNIVDNEVFRKFANFSLSSDLDGTLMTFYSNNSYFSFAKLDQEGYVCEVKEKEVISNNAISGFYFISKGKDFVNSAINVMIYGERDKNEFYISAVYQDLIEANKKIKTYNIDEIFIKCVGTPKQLMDCFNV